MKARVDRKENFGVNHLPSHQPYDEFTLKATEAASNTATNALVMRRSQKWFK